VRLHFVLEYRLLIFSILYKSIYNPPIAEKFLKEEKKEKEGKKQFGYQGKCENSIKFLDETRWIWRISARETGKEISAETICFCKRARCHPDRWALVLAWHGASWGLAKWQRAESVLSSYGDHPNLVKAWPQGPITPVILLSEAEFCRVLRALSEGHYKEQAAGAYG
jgi:hypothetical protein